MTYVMSKITKALLKAHCQNREETHQHSSAFQGTDECAHILLAQLHFKVGKVSPQRYLLGCLWSCKYLFIEALDFIKFVRFEHLKELTWNKISRAA